MGCFEYVTRLYPNDTQTHHQRPKRSDTSGAQAPPHTGRPKRGDTSRTQAPPPTPDTQKGETRAAGVFTTSGEINSPLRPMSLYNFLERLFQRLRLIHKNIVHGLHIRGLLWVKQRIQHQQFFLCQQHRKNTV